MTNLQNVLEDLVLILLHTNGRWTRKTIPRLKSFRNLFLHRWEEAHVDSATESAISRLAAEGLVSEEKTLEITKSGQSRAAQFFGIKSLKTPLAWDRQVLKGWLPAKALGIARSINAEGLDRLAKVEHLRGEILRLRFGFTKTIAPSEAQVRDGLGWLLLERGADPKAITAARKKGEFHATRIADVLMCSAADREFAAGKGQAVLASATLGIHASGWKDLYLELGRRAIEGRPFEVVAAAEREPNFEAIDDQRFASLVRRAAASVTDDRIGEHLVFVSHVWKKFVEAGSPISLPDFKQRLVQAHRTDQVVLAKADLPRALNPDDLSQSKIVDRNTVFTFVRI